MTDVLTPEQRSWCMSQIRGANTRPEMVVRSLVHGMGYRYRLHKRNLPGCPDLVLPAKRKIIFVHGCFWHMHNCSRGRVIPATNSEFWEKKRASNSKRDRATLVQLRKDGWEVLVIWECLTRKPESLRNKLTAFLST